MKLLSMNSFGLIFLTILLNPQACGCNCEDDSFQTIEERIYQDIEYIEQLKDNPQRATIEKIVQDELTCKNKDIKTANN